MSNFHPARGHSTVMDRLLYWGGFLEYAPTNIVPRAGHLPEYLKLLEAADAEANAKASRKPNWTPTPESREKARYAFNGQAFAVDFSEMEDETMAVLCGEPAEGMAIKWEHNLMTSHACRPCLPGEMQDGIITKVHGGNPPVVDIRDRLMKNITRCTFMKYTPLARVHDEVIMTSTPKSEDNHIEDFYRKSSARWSEQISTGRLNPQSLPKKDSIMRNIHGKLHNALNNITNRLFAEVSDVAIDVQTGSIGITGPRGVFTCEVKKTKATKATKTTPAEAASTTVELIENPLSLFELSIPAYAIRTTLDKVELGDIVLHNSTPYFVTKTTKTSLGLTGADGGEITIKGIKNTLTGDGGVLLVKNIAGGNMQQLLPLLLLSQGEDGDESKFSKLLMVMAVSGGDLGGLGDLGGGDLNSLLPLMLLSGNGSSGSIKEMLPLLLLTQNKGEDSAGLSNPLMLAALLG